MSLNLGPRKLIVFLILKGVQSFVGSEKIGKLWYIVYAKYQKASVKALVQVDFLYMHYLSTSKTCI